MYDKEIIVISLILLILCIIGIFIAFSGLIIVLKNLIELHKSKREYLIASNINDELQTSLDLLQKKINYRYNIHCVVCGRFASRIDKDSNIGDCKHHGIIVNTGSIVLPISIETVQENELFLEVR